MDPRGIVLDFCPTLDDFLLLCRAKIFGHRTKNDSPDCFWYCVQFPVYMDPQKEEDIADGDALSFLVDPRGIEPLSESLLI